jgi:deoxycytidylate deaminase
MSFLKAIEEEKLKKVINCAKLIYQTGISTVYYRNTYRENNGVEFLLKGGVDVKQI